MIVDKIPLLDTNILHPLVNDVMGNQYVGNEISNPDINSILKALDCRKFNFRNRNILSKVLKSQYESTFKAKIDISNQIELIESLSQENVFTVTTGHQLCLLTGPLYFIYKIASTIKLAKELNDRQSEKKVIPIFWMATEDHDFEEISSFFLFNKSFKWNRDSKGSVGRLDLEGLKPIVEEIESLLSNAPNKEILLNAIKDAYLGSENLAEATRKFVHFLFKDTDLIILDADNFKLKSLAVPIFKRELEEKVGFEEVSKQTQNIGNKYHLPVSPREINLFHISDSERSRILLENAESFLDVLQNNPEQISPNVIFRPVYQEIILPNIAYIGGTNEIAYWYQLKSLFQKLDVFYPELLVRSSALYLHEKKWNEITKLNLKPLDFLKGNSIDKIIEQFYHKNQKDLKMEEIFQNITALLLEVKPATNELNSSLGSSIAKQSNEIMANVKKIQKEIKSFKENNEEGNIQKIKKLYELIYIDKVFQERKQNFISIFANNGFDFINEITNNFNPLEKVIYLMK